MKLNVRYRGENITLEFEKEKVKAIDVLKALGLSRDFAFVVKNGEIASENDIITEQDDVKVVNAISGGVI